MIDWIHGKNYRFTINPVYETSEERIARGDWKSKIIGYMPSRIFLKDRDCDHDRWIGQKMQEWPVFESQADAIFEATKRARKLSQNR